ncbi:hypothetical protein Aglo02_38840 [Actinokineospora globicatena]|nr:hypothetical protein Aglo02_38840 [Actinokineospora globicatena]
MIPRLRFATAYWSGITVMWLLLAAMYYYYGWGYRSDGASVWAAAMAVIFLVFAIWTAILIVDVGPVYIRGGKLEFREKLRRRSLHRDDIESWKWTRYQQVRCNPRRYVTLTLTNGRTLSLRHRYFGSTTPAGRHANATLRAFFAPKSQ